MICASKCVLMFVCVTLRRLAALFDLIRQSMRGNSSDCTAAAKRTGWCISVSRIVPVIDTAVTWPSPRAHNGSSRLSDADAVGRWALQVTVIRPLYHLALIKVRAALISTRRQCRRGIQTIILRYVTRNKPLTTANHRPSKHHCEVAGLLDLSVTYVYQGCNQWYPIKH